MTLPVQSTVHEYATNDVPNADDGTIHSFACPCGSVSSGFTVFASAYIKSRKRSAKEK